jgi:hypothetical protein
LYSSQAAKKANSLKSTAKKPRRLPIITHALKLLILLFSQLQTEKKPPFIMKLLIFAVCLIVAVCAQAPPKYTTKYDNINLDDILKSERLLNNYFNCLMDRGKCTPDGNELKRTLPDALKTECAKCE